MRSKIISTFFLLSLVLLWWCNRWGIPWTASWLPEIFSVMPSNFDQILYFDIDEDLISLMETQYGANTPVAQEFSRIESLALWQTVSGVEWESLLFVQGKEVDVQQLAALGLVALDQSYETRNITSDIQVYGQKWLLDSKDFTWLTSSDITANFSTLLKNVGWNFWFISTPSNSGLWGLAMQFANKLVGTVWVIDLWNKLPSWEVHMLFKDGVVKKWDSQWTALSNSSETPLSLSTNNLSSLLWLDSAMLQTFLPLLLQPVLWDGASLLSSSDIKTLVQSMAWTMNLALVPNILWMWRRLSVDTSDAFSVFDSMYPVLDGYVKTTLFSWTQVDLVKEESLISWNTAISPWSWESIAFPLIEIEKSPESTTLSFMMVDDLAWPVQQWDTYSAETIAVWQVDFLMLTQMMWIESGDIITEGNSSIQLEMIAEEEKNMIRVVVE